MRPVPRQVWPVAGAVVAVVVVVAGTLALASPDDGVGTPTLGPSTVASSPTPSPTPTPTAAPSAVPEPSAVAPEAAAPPAATDPQAPAAPADYAELPAVPLDAPADYGNGLVARIVELERVQAQARGIGEVSGPGLAVTVELAAGDEQVDLGDVIVNLYGPSGAAAPVVAGDERHAPFAGVLRAGSSSRATYVLRPAEPDAPVRITVAYSGAVPAATFEGPLP